MKQGITRTIIRRHKANVILAVVFMLLLALFMLTSPQAFLSPHIYRAFLQTVPIIGILALGLTLVLVIGEIDLSFPSASALAGLVFAEIFIATGDSLLGLIGALVVGAAIGIANGLLITKVPIPSIVATLGMGFFLRGISDVLADGLARVLRGIGETQLSAVLIGDVGGSIPAQSLWFVGLAIVFALILFRHKFGNHILFVGDNPNTARMMSIDVAKTKIMVFVMMGVIAAFVGVLASVRLRTWFPTAGEGYLLPTMATVFVGGTSMFGGLGTILGTFISAFLVGSLEAGIVASGLGGFWTRLVFGLLILIAVAIHSLIERRRR
ncbi:MAG TPA: ABC transporter permease [Atribacteraceae bacterium]|nr:ABC transporter permease [Atribacteraceae bacterium]